MDESQDLENHASYQRAIRVLWLIAGVMILPTLILGGSCLGLKHTMVKKVQTKESPNREYKSELFRASFIDLNFSVKVNGVRVYGSPDFAPRPVDFQEQLLWDETGNIVILEIAGERLFGYDAKRKTKLKPKELLSVYIPTPSLSDLKFEGTAPSAMMLNAP